MQSVFHEMLRLGWEGLGRPDTSAKALLVALIAVLAFSWVARRLGKRLGVPAPEEGTLAVFLATATAILMLGAVVNVVIVPSLSDAGSGRGLLVATIVFVFLAVAVPLACWLQHGTYVRCGLAILGGFAITVGLMLIVAPLVYVVWHSVDSIEGKPIRGSNLSDFFLQ